MDNARYSDMRSCAKKVGIEMDYFVALASKHNIRLANLQPVKNRLERAPLRAYFINKIYDYLTECPDFQLPANLSRGEASLLFTQKIPFVYEVIITIQYLHNQILDGKCGVVSGEKVNDNLLIGNLLKDLLYDYIDDRFEPQLAYLLTKNVRKVFRLVDQGQEIEKRFNTYQYFQKSTSSAKTAFPELSEIAPLSEIEVFVEKLKGDLNPQNWAFTQCYLQRIYLTCGALFKEATQLLLDITQYEGKEKLGLLNFAACYGIMRQLVNDNADYIPSFYQLSTKGKTPEDALSDLQNKNVTLPLIFLLNDETGGCTLDYLNEQFTDIKSKEAEVFDQMLDSFALLKSIQNAKILGELAKNYLNPENPVLPLIADSCNIVQWNKFIFPCYRSEQYKAYKKTKYYKATKALLKQHHFSLNIQHEATAQGGKLSQGLLQQQSSSFGKPGTPQEA